MIQKFRLILTILVFLFLTSCNQTGIENSIDQAEKSGENFKDTNWILTGEEALVIGGYGDNFAYDGDGVIEAEGNFIVEVDQEANSGEVIVNLYNVKHEFGKDEFIEGEIRLEFTDFNLGESMMMPFMDGGVAQDIVMHGDTGQGPPVMPEIKTHLAGWGHINLYVNEELYAEALHGHFMYTDRAREDKKITNADGIIYSPNLEDKTGFFNSDLDEFHIVAHTMDEDSGNFPPNSKWIHVNFQQVNK